MAQKLKRSINMGFRVNEDEKYFIEKKMKLAGWTNFRSFVLNSLVCGEIVKLDLTEIREMNTLLRNANNNINQIAARVNSTSRIYEADISDKTNGYEFVKSYGCDYYTAPNDFALTKQLYEQQTGRCGQVGDILAYHVRQSFKPGEIAPEAALEVGYALMEKFTHGRHQFVVTVHTDKEHIHCHCIFSAVNMDCIGKFRNPMRSMKIVRQISAFLCAERGLSIVENPKPSRGSYLGWQDKKEPQSIRDRLRDLIDNSISAGMVFEQFIAAMHSAGCEVKRGKYLSFKLPDAERFIRVKSLGEDYTEEALRERCLGKRTVATRKQSDDNAGRKTAEYAAAVTKQSTPCLLIDVQAKIAAGTGAGYVHWMKIFNLKTAARTLIFLKENGIDSYDELVQKSEAAASEYHQLSTRLKEIGERQSAIAELQKQIGTYGKTLAAWQRYKKSGYDPALFEIERADITLHKAAKKYFDDHNFKTKLPSINSLKQEWATLEAERRSLSQGYKTAKENYMSICTAKANADTMLFGERQPQKSHDKDAR